MSQEPNSKLPLGDRLQAYALAAAAVVVPLMVVAYLPLMPVLVVGGLFSLYQMGTNYGRFKEKVSGFLGKLKNAFTIVGQDLKGFSKTVDEKLTEARPAEDASKLDGAESRAAFTQSAAPAASASMPAVVKTPPAPKRA